MDKEQQKQHLIDMMKADEELGLYEETLEEAAKYYAHNYFEMHDTNNYKALKQGFEAGAKWQAERMYSEEEVLKFTQTILMQYKFGNTDIEQMDLLKETFQLFKKK